MVSVTIAARGKPIPFAKSLPVKLELKHGFKVRELKAALQSRFPKLLVNRQRLTVESSKKALDDDATVDEVVKNGDTTIFLKDLGPQVSWTTVFLVEYAGPLVIHPLAYHFPKVFYGTDVNHSLMQKFAYALVLLHFIKREYETFFVHRFSNGTMPVFNILKNSAHYHLLCGVLLAGALYGPWNSAAALQNSILDSPIRLWACTAAWAFAELSNLKTHYTLRNLRPPGTRIRAIPYGYGFSLVSCPNYMFEVLAWVVFTFMTQSWASALFTIVGIAQMSLWAIKKHKAYKKDFGSAYPRRNVIFPFIL